MKILNFGSLNIDYVYRVKEIAKAGETVKGKERKIYCGGKGLNQSIALANAGAEVYHAGIIGEDGSILTDRLKSSNVNTEFVKMKEGSSSHTIIQVDDRGNNCIVFYSDSGLAPKDEDIEQVLDNFDENDYLLVQNELGCSDRIIRLAKGKGMKIVLNPSPFTDDLRLFPLEDIDIFLINETEGQQFTGEREPVWILEKMRKKYPEAIVVLTMGEEGAYCLARGEVLIQKAYQVETVDTTAAGDTFTGFFLAEYLRTGILENALQVAAKAAAIAVTRMGAADSIPRLEEIG